MNSLDGKMVFNIATSVLLDYYFQTYSGSTGVETPTYANLHKDLVPNHRKKKPHIKTV